MGDAPHTPVLETRITELLAVTDPATGPGLIVDCTLGAGGHAAALLAASHESIQLIGIDRDAHALDLAGGRLATYGDRARLVHAPFDELDEVLAGTDVPVLGILYDLGVSSMQLDDGARGFSFRSDAPLDLRMDPGSGESAAELLARLDVDELARILASFGEVRAARRIARAVIAARPTTTRGLADAVRDATPAALRRSAKTHPATQTFQALRIAVNGELDRLRASLPQALRQLARPGEDGPPDRGGRLAVLAYHSLEDRIVKRFFTDAAAGCSCPPGLPVCACGRVPLVMHLARAETAGPGEVAANPRARSARLRVVARTDAAPDPRMEA